MPRRKLIYTENRFVLKKRFPRDIKATSNEFTQNQFFPHSSHQLGMR